MSTVSPSLQRPRLTIGETTRPQLSRKQHVVTVLLVNRKVGWGIELWAGTIVLSGLVMAGLFYLMFPPPIPTREQGS